MVVRISANNEAPIDHGTETLQDAKSIARPIWIDVSASHSVLMTKMFGLHCPRLVTSAWQKETDSNDDAEVC